MEMLLADAHAPDPTARLCRQHGVELFLAVDEVGRGPLAGPVVTGAVLWRVGMRIKGVADSKELTAAQREALVAPITTRSLAVAVAEAGPDEIDAVGIVPATHGAMKRALLSAWRAGGKPSCLVLVDGRERLSDLPMPAHAVVDGDARVPAIGAASILAKQHRDAYMDAMALQHPGYGFERHKGYATREHMAALVALGPSPLHRRCFEPIRTFVATGAWPQLHPTPVVEAAQV